MYKPSAWVRGEGDNIYTGFLRCIPRVVHWVMSAEFDVSFAQGFCAAFFSLGVLSDLSLVDFYMVVKFWGWMQARVCASG